MIKFKTLSLGDKNLFQRYLKNYKFRTYEYSFLTLFLWKKYCNVEYAIIHDALVLKKYDEKAGPYFMQPIGYSQDSLEDIIKELKKIKQEDPAFKYLFKDIEEPFVNQLRAIYGPNILYCEDTKNFDYIYESQRLIDLKGEKLRKRKNHYNQFVNSYSFEVRDIRENGVIEGCLEFAERWFETQKIKTKQMVCEIEGIREVLGHLDELNALGMAVYVDNKVIGFTIGEKVNSNMAVVHVEKGDIDYKGIYAFINRTFVEKYLSDVQFINREEDLGIPGLRKAKLAYDPIKLEKKFVVQSIFCEASIDERFTIRA